VSKFEGGGLQAGKVAYYVGNLPYRKRVMLYRSEGPVIQSVASFTTEEDAAEFLRWLQSLANTTGGEPHA
jgi:uncharacterized protein YigA (DUF484 family)